MKQIAPTTAALTQAPSQADQCAKASPPRLKAGDRAKISKPSSPVFPGAYLKLNPDRVGPVLRYLPLNTVVDVVAGPRCGADKGYWYQVKYGDLTAWVAEVVGKDYAIDLSTDPASKPISTTAASTMLCIRSSAAPAVTTIGPAEFDEFFPPERNAAVPAGAGLDVDLGFVEEFHGWLI